MAELAPTDGTINLAAARAARREGRMTEIRITLVEGEDAIVLPVELPLEALNPLRALQLDQHFGLVFQSRTAQQAEELFRDLITVRPALFEDALAAGTGVLERLFCTCAVPPWHRSPERLPTAAPLTTGGEGVLAVADAAALAVMPPPPALYDPQHDAGETRCQWTRFVEWQPTAQDVKELLAGLWAAYGANLGEAFAPSGSSGPGGTTSKRTSGGATKSTRAKRGKTPATRGS